MKIDAVILAGGRSSRMGRDKAFLLFEGRTLLSRQLETVAALEPAELFISIRPGMDCGEHRATLLVDRWPDAGPLAGVERALDAARSALLLVLAVDMPAMTPEILRDLCAKSRGDAGVVPRVGGHLEPLAAVFPKSAHHLACDMLRTGRHAVNEFVLQCAEAGLVEIADCPSADARFFENWNRPADVEQPGVGSAPSA